MGAMDEMASSGLFTLGRTASLARLLWFFQLLCRFLPANDGRGVPADMSDKFI